MRTFQKVKGTPIFFKDKGKFIGKISDLVLSANKDTVNGYWVQTSQWWSKKHFLPIEDIVHIDGEGMYVSKKTKLKPMSKKSEIRLCDGKDHILGKALRDKHGLMVGLIEDVYFLPDSGKIVGYELTEGLFSDLKRGILVVKPKVPFINQNNSFVEVSDL
ncbi:PRC-barrel domain-containing protein [Evansella sp. AB-P1]|uniref:PRC-barrel domain-containing protein n=1 Tax=Evansella sp. AB-P1 TaxID=3037653 RepID=UPI00241FD533|nr:PRC-barrel domain-containing protein [Evansella sp. AB-P1]MDG5786470.1 PRC-barrel domain-containing protein [Evansella sp. AB-P1]